MSINVNKDGVPMVNGVVVCRLFENRDPEQIGAIDKEMPVSINTINFSGEIHRMLTNAAIVITDNKDEKNVVWKTVTQKGKEYRATIVKINVGIKIGEIKLPASWVTMTYVGKGTCLWTREFMQWLDELKSQVKDLALNSTTNQIAGLRNQVDTLKSEIEALKLAHVPTTDTNITLADQIINEIPGDIQSANLKSLRHTAQNIVNLANRYVTKA